MVYYIYYYYYENLAQGYYPKWVHHPYLFLNFLLATGYFLLKQSTNSTGKGFLTFEDCFFVSKSEANVGSQMSIRGHICEPLSSKCPWLMLLKIHLNLCV